MTRSALIVLVGATTSTPLANDLLLFAQWSEEIAAGALPAGDKWQYPPGMALALGAIGALGLGVAGLLTLILASDFAILRALRDTSGSRYWAWAPTLMGPLVLTRMDMVVTLLGVLGCMPAVGARRSGVLLGLGASLKIWPGALVAALPRSGAAVRAGWVAMVYVTTAVAAWALFGDVPFIANQSSRGLQIEAVAAWPFLVAQRLGAPVDVVFRNGAMEIASPIADAIAAVLPFASLAAVAGVTVVAWHRNPTGPLATRALSLICLLLVTSRVLSPQYNIWILGFVAVTVAYGICSRSILIASALTCLAATAYYPFFYELDNSGLALQTMRVVSLLWLTVSCVRLTVGRRGCTVATDSTWTPSQGLTRVAP